MKVALDISPIQTGHRVRGIGSYTEKLKDQFQKERWGISFEYFQKPSSPPPADLVHYPYFDLFFKTLPLKKTVKRVVTIHDVIPLVFPKYFPAGIKGYLNLFFQKKALKKTDAVICDSQTSKSDIINKLSVPPEKIHVIYLAPGENFQKSKDQNKLKKVTSQYHLPKNFVLYVGDVNWNKNIHNLLEAVNISKVNMVMVGQALVDKNLPQTREINNQIRRLKIESKITRTGYINSQDLVAIYNLAELTVLPSFYEGFGLPVLESMACGTPVVCSNVASLTEIAKPQAIFCDPSNPKDIAEKIKAITSLSTKQKETLSKKSQTHASTFTWHKTASQTVKVYKSLTS